MLRFVREGTGVTIVGVAAAAGIPAIVDGIRQVERSLETDPSLRTAIVSIRESIVAGEPS